MEPVPDEQGKQGVEYEEEGERQVSDMGPCRLQLLPDHGGLWKILYQACGDEAVMFEQSLCDRGSCLFPQESACCGLVCARDTIYVGDIVAGDSWCKTKKR
jgi:hypothetical protein